MAQSLGALVIRSTRWGRRRKLAVTIALDVLVLAVATTALALAYSALCACTATSPGLPGLMLGCVGGALTILWCAGTYRAVLRHWSVRMHVVLLFGSGAAAFVGSLLFGWVYGISTIIYSFPLLWASYFAPLLSWRVLASALLFRRTGPPQGRAPSVVVYGAGLAGAQLVAALLAEAEYDVVALIDDNPDLQGRTVHGRPILSPQTLDQLLSRNAIERVVVAMPSATAAQRRAVLNRLAHFPVEVRTLPPLSDIVAGRSRFSEMLEVAPEELLSREPVRANFELLRNELSGKSVLVTGGGGSIGSALCREILRHRPARIVVFEISEFALYQIERELKTLAEEMCPTVEIRPVLGSILSKRDIEHAISSNRVEIVYHAAAYKHVPLVELNPMRGVENNVFGTVNVAQAAQHWNVEKFVLISTDKAVRPTNVMGASKRLAEKALEALSQRGGVTRFALVRFGNVLDSAGSVVPLFREQIRRGGPITVTHPEVTRYFMTIPEAAELVIQAGAMAEQGVDVFHLDMGEPVRISDLARKLIHLSGYKVAEVGAEDQEGIAIDYVGLRPGEKLYEELLVNGAALPTAHPRIFRARDVSATWSTVQRHLARLTQAVDNSDIDVLHEVLHESVEAFGATPMNAGVDAAD